MRSSPGSSDPTPAESAASSPSQPAGRRRLTRRKKLLFALLPLAALFVAAEVFARGYRARKAVSPFMTGSYRDLRIDLIRRAYPAAHDPLLGYVPRPGFRSDDNPWHHMVSIDEHGLRNNGGTRPAGEHCVLAVGDSFTFGDGVGDADSWPARLERKLGLPVLNGGVFGYSLAQTVLRAEQLMARFPTGQLVLSYIPDDLVRCEQSRRFTDIPWFALEGGELALRGVPVPDSANGTTMDRQYVRKLLGYSAAIDMLCWNIAPRWWVAEQREIWVHPEGTGVVIGKKLLERLARKCAERHAPWMVVLQGHWQDPGSNEVLDHARRFGADVLDLQAEFLELARDDPSLHKRYFPGHMSAAGNEWVAGRIAEALRHTR